MTFEATRDSDFYQYYPYEFEAEVIYTLDEGGLHQEFRLTNYSEGPMPYGLGWHTAFAVRPDTRVRISLGRRVLLNGRALPTGELRDLSEEEKMFRSEEGQSPVYAAMDDHFTAEPIQVNGEPFHGAVLLDADSGRKVYYRLDGFYKHWMVWNCSQEGSFICIEPQNWRVNAPNLELDASEAGLGVLEEQETVSVWADIYVE